MTDQSSKYLGIKSWSEEDRPREKMVQQGSQALSNAELVAILIGSGTREHSAVDVGKRLLHQASNDLNKLGKFSVHQLVKINGIGNAKAVSVSAALELGRRRKSAEMVNEKPKITSSDMVYEYIYPYFADLAHESFYVVLLNRANDVIGHHQISQGGISGTTVDPKIVFKAALDQMASSIILCHNHPSGNKTPSKPDEELTHKIKSAGELLDIKVLDHIIFAEDTYYSFADEGKL